MAGARHQPASSELLTFRAVVGRMGVADDVKERREGGAGERAGLHAPPPNKQGQRARQCRPRRQFQKGQSRVCTNRGTREGALGWLG